MRRSLYLAAAMALGLVACRSSQPKEIIRVEELDSGIEGVAFVGAPTELKGELGRNVKDLLERFVETGRRSLIDDAAYDSELFLRERGYADAVVSYQTPGDNRAQIDVAAGERSTIGRVLVYAEPGCPIEPEALRLYVNGPRTGLFGTGAMLYVETRIARAPGLIEDDLAALGYLNATASLENPGPRTEGGPVDVALHVNARKRFVVSSAAFELDRAADALGDHLAEKVQASIDAATKGSPDGPTSYEPRLGGTLRTIVSDVLGQGGYPDASVQVIPKIDRDTQTVSLRVIAQPGPYVTLGLVKFEGAERTTDSFLSSRMLLDTGDTFDARKVRDTVRGLYRTGLFSEVTPRLIGAGDSRDLTIGLKEQPSRELFFEPGFGSYELARATIGARDRNLFGKGIAAIAEATVATRAVRGTVSLTDPWLLRRELIGDLRLEFNRREEPSFTRESRGAGAFITKEWTAASATTIGYRLSRSEARDIEAVDDDVLEAQSVVNVAGLILTQRYDTRDALFAPSSGVYAEASVEVATQGIGSELEFVRPKVTAAWFESMGADDVIGLGMRAGIIAPSFGETTIPIQERFFAGGENSVRSFRESQLGPEDANGQPLGGEGFASASLEWRHELGGAFQSAAFFDAGLVEEQASDLFDFESVRMGVGVGLRYLLPIGPIRIDAAFNPDRRSDESEWVVHFGIGMPF